MANIDGKNWKKGTDAASTAFNANQAAMELKSLTSQSNANKGVTGDQIRTLRSNIDSYTQFGSVTLNGKSIDGTLDDLAKMADAEQAGKPLKNSDANWASDMAFLTDAATQIANFTQAGATAMANPVPVPVGANGMPVPRDAATLRAEYAGGTSPLSDKESVFKRVNNKLGEDIKAGASEGQIKQDIADCYSAYNDSVGDNGKRNWDDFQKHLGEQFAKSATPEAAKNWSDWSNQLFSSSATQYVGYKPPAAGSSTNDGSDYVGTTTV